MVGNARLRRWNAGKTGLLLQEALGASTPARRLRPRTPSDEQDWHPSVQRAVKTAVREGALHKAAALLLENSPPENSTEDALRALRPSRRTPAAPVPCSKFESIMFSTSVAAKASKTIPPWIDLRTLRLLPVHLIEMLRADDDETLLQALTHGLGLRQWEPPT
jgi:hypothetical protein